MSDRLTREQVAEWRGGWWKPTRMAERHDALCDEVLALMDDNDRLREALDKYADHSRVCPVSLYGEHKDCTCGFDRALAVPEGETK